MELYNQTRRGRLNNIWNNMRKRCYYPKSASYKDYGAKSIKIDWLSFEDFYRDMASSYQIGLSIDRIDNTKNYNKENCRWIRLDQQSRNRKCVTKHEFRGKKLTLGEWARKLGIKRSTLSQRFYVYKWDLSRCLSKK